MDQLVRVFRVASSPAAVVLLVAVNLVPLAGVLLWGWNVQSLLILYWVENGIIGVLAIARILRAEGPIEVPGVRVKLTGAASASRAVIVPFFVMHYGIFWAVHGIFVFTLPLFMGIPGMVEDGRGVPVIGPDGLPALEQTAYAGVRWGAVGLGALGLAISHGASFVLNYLGRGEYLRTSPSAQATAPYGRVIVLHMTIILGVFVSMTLGSPIGSLVVLVVIKTIIDLGLHLAEHRKAAPSTIFSST